MRAYHHLDDVGPVCFALAVAVSSYLDGPPLWGMLVGAPSGGKSEALSIVDKVAKERVDGVTMPGVLSSLRNNRTGLSKPVGTLKRIGARGLLSISDFSTVLSDSQRGRRDDLFAILRRVYDGRVQRDLGNEEKPLIWEGRVTILVACTSSIDNYASLSDRWGRGSSTFAWGLATGRRSGQLPVGRLQPRIQMRPPIA
jgi:hypothetical protein